MGADEGLTVGPPDGPRRWVGRPVFGAGLWRVAPLGPGAWSFEAKADPESEDAVDGPSTAPPDAVPLGITQIIPADPSGEVFLIQGSARVLPTDPTGRCASVSETRDLEGDTHVVRHLIDLRSGKSVTLERTFVFRFADR